VQVFGTPDAELGIIAILLKIAKLVHICYTVYSLRPESSENIPILLQEADPYFSNQNDLRNPKMGSKQSVTGPTH
jgi:hypothetical protein